MKVVTILGTRPEIIRLSRVIPLLDLKCRHIVVHTGQNYDKRLSDVFFSDFKLRAPNEVIDSRSDTVMEQIGKILVGCERILARERPDRVLILGDTNSALSSIVAKRFGIPVYHMEAGNRCFDDRVPEEVNRRVIDHSSDVLLPYTENSKRNLTREGIPDGRIVVTGNPIFEVLNFYAGDIDASKALETFKVSAKKYLLVTLHRSENVDSPERLNSFVQALNELNAHYRMPVLCSLHPRTRSKLAGKNFDTRGITMIEPPGFFDFVKLQKNAFCVLTDSGTVQEETCILKVPSVTLRDVTERPETVEVGSNVLTGADKTRILDGVAHVTGRPCDWTAPKEYLVPDVSRIVTDLLLSPK